jgi:hypothetical protein
VHTVRVLSERFWLGELLLVSTPALLASVGVLHPALLSGFFPAWNACLSALPVVAV